MVVSIELGALHGRVMASSDEPGPDNSISEFEKAMASPGSLLKHGYKPDSPQYDTSKLLSHVSSGGAEKSNYGSFLATEETTSVVSSSSSLLSKREPVKTLSGLAFVNVSYQVPPKFGWLPGNTMSKAKTILRPARYILMCLHYQGGYCDFFSYFIKSRKLFPLNFQENKGESHSHRRRV